MPFILLLKDLEVVLAYIALPEPYRILEFGLLSLEFLDLHLVKRLLLGYLLLKILLLRLFLLPLHLFLSFRSHLRFPAAELTIEAFNLRVQGLLHFL